MIIDLKLATFDTLFQADEPVMSKHVVILQKQKVLNKKLRIIVLCIKNILLIHEAKGCSFCQVCSFAPCFNP
jgi:hypothetical protein